MSPPRGAGRARRDGPDGLIAIGGLAVGGAMVACGESAGCETPGVGLALGDGF